MGGKKSLKGWFCYHPKVKRRVSNILTQQSTTGSGPPSGHWQSSASVQSKEPSKGLTLRSSTELILLSRRYRQLLQRNEWLVLVIVTQILVLAGGQHRINEIKTTWQGKNNNFRVFACPPCQEDFFRFQQARCNSKIRLSLRHSIPTASWTSLQLDYRKYCVIIPSLL